MPIAISDWLQNRRVICVQDLSVVVLHALINHIHKASGVERRCRNSELFARARKRIFDIPNVDWGLPVNVLPHQACRPVDVRIRYLQQSPYLNILNVLDLALELIRGGTIAA